jgi:hypothetical protein
LAMTWVSAGSGARPQAATSSMGRRKLIRLIWGPCVRGREPNCEFAGGRGRSKGRCATTRRLADRCAHSLELPRVGCQWVWIFWNGSEEVFRAEFSAPRRGAVLKEPHPLSIANSHRAPFVASERYYRSLEGECGSRRWRKLSSGRIRYYTAIGSMGTSGSEFPLLRGHLRS